MAQAGGPTNVPAIDASPFDTQSLGALRGTTYTEMWPATIITADLSLYNVLQVGSPFQEGFVTVPS